MLGPTSTVSAAIRAAALTTLFAFTAASTALAATTLPRPGSVRAGSPQWFLSHLDSHRTLPRSAVVRNASATAYPLDGPFGLAVAPNGDLYVANLLADQILVYGSNLVQKTGATISAGLSHPTGVAIDSTGEVFVSNMASNVVTVYSKGHTLLPNRTITSNVSMPAAIAVDGLDNVYVDEGYASVGLYSNFGLYGGNLSLSSALGTVNSIATRGQFFMLSGSNAVQYTLTENLIAAVEFPSIGLVNGYFSISANDSLGVAPDGNGNLYEVTDDPAIVSLNPLTGVQQRVTTLPFVPAAIAIDSDHNHVFVADLYHNAIAVYTLTGHLVTTLH